MPACCYIAARAKCLLDAKTNASYDQLVAARISTCNPLRLTITNFGFLFGQNQVTNIKTYNRLSSKLSLAFAFVCLQYLLAFFGKTYFHPNHQIRIHQSHQNRFHCMKLEISLSHSANLWEPQPPALLN